MKLSAVINCFNEEDFVSYAMKSIYPFCDEIIIVDNASTDSTKANIEKFILDNDIAQKVKPFYLSEPMQLGKVRNFALDKATNEWIIKWDGDFCAYGEDTPRLDNNIAPFSDLIKIVEENQNAYDIFLLYSINICGDIYHHDKTRKYLGLSGDSFIGKKSCMKYGTSDKYGDVGILKKPDGSTPKFYYLNKPDVNPMYFVHLYGIKPDEYLLYRRFLSEYQVWIDRNEPKEFWDWAREVKNIDINSGLSYVSKQLVQNLERHNLPLPKILKPEEEDLKYEVLYDENNNPIGRVKN